MAFQGPVLIIEDDADDADVIVAAIKNLGTPNEILHFRAAQDAIDYLKTTTDKPLLLLSDVRMPGMDGLSLLKRIQGDEYLRLKAIPFVFLTSLDSQEIIDEAFNIGVQGFYIKPQEYVPLRDMVRVVITYWLRSKHPSASYFERGPKRAMD